MNKKEWKYNFSLVRWISDNAKEILAIHDQISKVFDNKSFEILKQVENGFFQHKS